jgi:hypothetical protein
MNDKITEKNKDIFDLSKHTDIQIIELLGLIAADGRYRRLQRFERMVEIIEGHLDFGDKK